MGREITEVFENSNVKESNRCFVNALLAAILCCSEGPIVILPSRTPNHLLAFPGVPHLLKLHEHLGGDGRVTSKKD